MTHLDSATRAEWVLENHVRTGGKYETRELAKMLGVTPQCVSNYLTGRAGKRRRIELPEADKKLVCDLHRKKGVSVETLSNLLRLSTKTIKRVLTDGR